MFNFIDLESQFLMSVKKLSAETGRCEISAVLNEMPIALSINNNFEYDKNLIIRIDELVNQLYKKGRLTFPAHKWLSGPSPESVSGRITSSFDYGSLCRNEMTNTWEWKGETTYFYMMEFESEFLDLEENRLQ